jgi:hypothetical protein
MEFWATLLGSAAALLIVWAGYVGEIGYLILYWRGDRVYKSGFVGLTLLLHPLLFLLVWVPIGQRWALVVCSIAAYLGVALYRSSRPGYVNRGA